MSAVKFDIGDQIRLAVAFTNLAGAATDPTVVTCSARAPDNTTASLNVVNSAVGSYHAFVTATLAGTYFFRFAGTGTLIVAEEGQFYVRERNV